MAPPAPLLLPTVAAATEPRSVGLGAPWTWLRRGWADLVRCPGPGLLHGAACAAFGGLLFAFFHQRFWWLAGAFSGFLIVAPIVATGLYRISRELESGRRCGLHEALAAWHPRDGRLVRFGLLLGLAGTGWVLTSASLITAFSPEQVRNPLDFLRHVVLREQGLLFEAWLVLGGVLAAPVFASSVVALPMLLDRPVTVLQAVLGSWRAVVESPAPMALWAALLMLLTLAGMAAGLVGLIVVVPWLAHASWHAYRDLYPPGAPAP